MNYMWYVPWFNISRITLARVATNFLIQRGPPNWQQKYECCKSPNTLEIALPCDNVHALSDSKNASGSDWLLWMYVTNNKTAACCYCFLIRCLTFSTTHLTNQSLIRSLSRRVHVHYRMVFRQGTSFDSIYANILTTLSWCVLGPPKSSLSTQLHTHPFMTGIYKSPAYDPGDQTLKNWKQITLGECMWWTKKMSIKV